MGYMKVNIMSDERYKADDEWILHTAKCDGCDKVYVYATVLNNDGVCPNCGGTKWRAA
jgi:rRNA maturation endonuclease Nob1